MMVKKRILHCIPTMGGGGAERQLCYLSEGLVELGWEVHVALLRQGPNLGRLQGSGARVHFMRASTNYSPLIVWYLVRLVRELRPDLVHTSILQMDILGGFVARITRTAWLLREPNSKDAYPGNWKHRLRVWVARGADVIVSNSAGGNAYWGACYPDKARHVISNGLPLESMENTPACSLAELALEADHRLVLYAGRLTPHKNVDRLISALGKVMSDLPIVAIFCGDGSDRQVLEEQARASGLSDRVRFTGFVPSAQVWALMKRADVFVGPSAYEGLPNVVMEAMACGCPLVVSDIRAHRAFLDEGSALLVDPYDAAEIAAAIRLTLSDPTGAHLRARRAKETAARWSIPAMVREYEQVYRDVLARRGTA